MAIKILKKIIRYRFPILIIFSVATIPIFTHDTLAYSYPVEKVMQEKMLANALLECRNIAVNKPLSSSNYLNADKKLANDKIFRNLPQENLPGVALANIALGTNAINKPLWCNNITWSMFESDATFGVSKYDVACKEGSLSNPGLLIRKEGGTNIWGIPQDGSCRNGDTDFLFNEDSSAVSYIDTFLTDAISKKHSISNKNLIGNSIQLTNAELFQLYRYEYNARCRNNAQILDTFSFFSASAGGNIITSCKEIASKISDRSSNSLYAGIMSIASPTDKTEIDAWLADVVAYENVEGDGDNNSEAGTAAPSCQSTAGAMSWIICPAIDGITAAADYAYNIISDLLEVEPELLSTTDSNGNTGGAFNAWTQFRDIANIIFVVLLLIVVISQITGFGISNYGIKTVLPRLIVSAILINVSYYICQIAVDISNIIGGSIEGFLTGLSGYENTTNSGLEVKSDGSAVWNIVGVAVTIAVAAVAVFFFIAPIGLAILAAVFTLLMVLAIQKAGVVLLVAASPIAFACYILPNTQGIFRTWWKMFKTLIILYPLCALLVGAGKLTSGILYQVEAEGLVGFIMTIIGLIAQVVPYFFILTILKKTLEGMDYVGAAVRGYNNKVQGAKQGVQNSDAFKRANAGYRNKVFGRAINAAAGNKVGRALGAGVLAGSIAKDLKAGSDEQQQRMKAGADMWADRHLEGKTDLEKEAIMAKELNAAVESGDKNRIQQAFTNAGTLKKGGKLMTNALQDKLGDKKVMAAAKEFSTMAGNADFLKKISEGDKDLGEAIRTQGQYVDKKTGEVKQAGSLKEYQLGAENFADSGREFATQRPDVIQRTIENLNENFDPQDDLRIKTEKAMATALKDTGISAESRNHIEKHLSANGWTAPTDGSDNWIPPKTTASTPTINSKTPNDVPSEGEMFDVRGQGSWVDSTSDASPGSSVQQNRTTSLPGSANNLDQSASIKIDNQQQNIDDQPAAPSRDQNRQLTYDDNGLPTNPGLTNITNATDENGYSIDPRFSETANIIRNKDRKRVDDILSQPEAPSANTNDTDATKTPPSNP